MELQIARALLNGGTEWLFVENNDRVKVYRMPFTGHVESEHVALFHRNNGLWVTVWAANEIIFSEKLYSLYHRLPRYFSGDTLPLTDTPQGNG